MKTNKMNDNRISRVLKCAVSLAVGISLLAFAPTKSEAAASQFDMTFGTAGKVVTDFGGFDALNDMATQANGKIVAVGSMESDFAVARYNSNGTLDTTFDGDGKVTTDLSSIDQGNALAIQVDGKIIVFGICSSGSPSFCLARYNVNGSLDTTFDGDGKVITDLPNNQRANDIVIQPDGKIVVVGASFTGPATEDFTIARYNSNGTLDTTFNTNGYVVTPLSGTDIAVAVALQNDGKIIAVGQSGNDFSLFRYNSNGSLDTSFDTDGIVTTNIAGNDIANDVIIQPDGKIIAAGGTSDDIALARYNANGSLDLTFDSDGKVTADMGGFDNCFAAALQPNGKIVAVGYIIGSGMAVSRFNPNGSLDTSFHGDGKLNTVITGDDLARAVAIQNDGKIVVGGSPNGGTGNFALARFLGDPRKTGVNFNPIAPADRVGVNPPGIPTTNYPAPIALSGMTGTVSKVRVTISMTHTFPADLDVLLVGPNGQRTILMSDVGGGNPGITTQSFFGFDQSAELFPANATPIEGYYRPNNHIGNPTLEPGGIDVFPPSGPGSNNYGEANLDVFNGTNPNGLWQLFVVDDEAGDVGSIGAWAIDITTTTSRLNNLTADYDGDSRTDISIFRPSNGQWWQQSSFTNQVTAATFGVNTDKIAPADYTGDGKTDIAFWRPSNGQWFVLRSEDNTFFAFPFGTNGDIPQPGDYDGDGRADAAVFRIETRTWFIFNSSGGTTIQEFGIPGDIPVAADYDGDGKHDIGIYRPNGANGAEWWHQRSSTNVVFAAQFGLSTDKPVQADYTGDGKADIAFFRPSNANWFVLRSEDLSFFAFPFGANGDRPAPGDYDGDGKADAGVFRPSDTTWYISKSTGGTLIQQFGTTGDLPTPSAFVP